MWTGALIAGATLVRLLFVTSTDIANGEAYYYVWSRFPALSYYDHPPLVAWMTWLTTRLSHGSLAIRVGPLLCAALFAVLLYRLGDRLFSPRAGFIAVAIVTVIPVFFASSYALNPEAPLAPLWVLGLVLLERMREHDEPWRPLAAGAVAGLAFLAKYSGVLLLAVRLALSAGLAHGPALAPPAVALPRGPGGAGGGAPGADLEPPAGLAVAGAPLRRAPGSDRPGGRSPSTPGTRIVASSARSTPSSSRASWSCWRSASAARPGTIGSGSSRSPAGRCCSSSWS